MSKNVVSRVDRNLARRLREARREVGLSTRGVAEKLPRKLAVSYGTIASYENGTTTPPVNVLAALADIYRRPINWFLENRESLSGFRYWNMRPRVKLADQRHFEAQAGKWVEAYMNLQDYLKDFHPRSIRTMEVPEDLHPETLAATVRRELLNLEDDAPIQNVVGVLESFSAWALEIRAAFGIDGAAARHGDAYVVVVNPELANERLRMNAAHELAHVLYEGWKEPRRWAASEVEQKAFAFAAALLLPESQLKVAFEGKSFLKLIQYKEKFGLSLSAMIYMAEKASIINTTAARWLWSEMAKRGWRQKEPGYVWRDRAITFETMLECAIHTKQLTWSDAERVTGIREDELRDRLQRVLDPVGPEADTGIDATIKFIPNSVADDKGR